jgi:hydroxymethylpyrimidine pyrophosphatase-like HAD family hydrolase/fructoselysine-6-P-deglycase FrlB-like protein
MTSTVYDTELARLSETYALALKADIRELKVAIAGASRNSLIGIGSGGSYTVASFMCGLHETYTGRVSRPSTPLEIICNPTLAASSPAFFISAEGKNPDILEALERARQNSARSLHVLTNHAPSPLLDCVTKLTDINTYIFGLSEKDGFLATNSLLLDSTVLARAYGELDGGLDELPSLIEEFHLGSQTIGDWIAQASAFAKLAVERRGLIIIHSPNLRPVATDVESKLSEAALLYCQVADLRSFAHGRHLWLADRPNDCAILVLLEASLHSLWEQMVVHVPTTIPTFVMSLESGKPKDLLAGLIAGMHFVSLVSGFMNRDPGRPDVPQFGRELHYLKLADAIAPLRQTDGHEQDSKYDVLGAWWPLRQSHGRLERALENYKRDVEQQVFRALVFDYDGTLCRSSRDDVAPLAPILERIRVLIDAGILVAIASGRGGSVQERMREHLPEALWGKILLGLYNGGWVGDVSSAPPSPGSETSEFLSHVTRIIGRLKELGVPIETIRVTHPYQVSVRFREGVHGESMWPVIADALRQAGLDLSSIVHSKHSVDVLEAGINKSHLIAHIIQECKIDPYEILTLGDQGAWPGNDASLLEHRFSLSVDIPSRRVDRGWKFAPLSKRDVDATVWYLERINPIGEGRFKIVL